MQWCIFAILRFVVDVGPFSLSTVETNQKLVDQRERDVRMTYQSRYQNDVYDALRVVQHRHCCWNGDRSRPHLQTPCAADVVGAVRDTSHHQLQVAGLALKAC